MKWSSIQRVIDAAFSRRPKAWGPEVARVVRVHLAAGRAGGLERPHAVDVQLLDADGNPRGDVPELQRVELPAPGLGPGAVAWAVPAEDSLVRVGFYGGRLSRPYIAAVLQDGGEVPARTVGQVLCRIGSIDLVVDRDGNLDVHGAGQLRFGRSAEGTHDLVMCYSDASADLAQLEERLLDWAAGVNQAITALDGAVQQRLTAAQAGVTTPGDVTSAPGLQLSLTHGTPALNLSAEVASGD